MQYLRKLTYSFHFAALKKGKVAAKFTAFIFEAPRGITS
jgi:hypothetical protein